MKLAELFSVFCASWVDQKKNRSGNNGATVSPEVNQELNVPYLQILDQGFFDTRN